jgi:hypothetical protein
LQFEPDNIIELKPAGSRIRNFRKPGPSLDTKAGYLYFCTPRAKIAPTELHSRRQHKVVNYMKAELAENLAEIIRLHLPPFSLF